MQLIAFIACWMAYLLAVGVGLILCAVTAISPAARTSAKRFAAGLVGSVPGVAVLQLVGLPVVAVIVGLLWALQRALGQPTGVGGIIWGVVVVLGTVGVMALVSLAGFASGWATGVRVFTGIPIGAALRESLVFRLWRRKCR
jgi:hypothetical protein